VNQVLEVTMEEDQIRIRRYRLPVAITGGSGPD
jgi:hypothetical protein